MCPIVVDVLLCRSLDLLSDFAFVLCVLSTVIAMHSGSCYSLCMRVSFASKCRTLLLVSVLVPAPRSNADKTFSLALLCVLNVVMRVYNQCPVLANVVVTYGYLNIVCHRLQQWRDTTRNPDVGYSHGSARQPRGVYPDRTR